jgi:nucleotide sugar dehydrogenase
VIGPRWSGDADDRGTVAVVGLGKIGLALAAQYASKGWRVIGVDVLPHIVEAVSAGTSHIAEEPALAERVAAAHAAGTLEASGDHAAAAAAADVVVVIVPVMLTPDSVPDYRYIDAATSAIAPGLRPGTLVVYETTPPAGVTRGRLGPLLEEGSGLQASAADGFWLAFSPERVSSGRIFDDLATYPKLVGGADPTSTARAAAFYRSVLDAEVWELSGLEAAELAKLAETTYRDVNIAFANELARHAERVGVDVLEVIRAANSQPYSHIHAPGIGVGGHCIPVYPWFLLAGATDLELVRRSRATNDAQVAAAVESMAARVGGLAGVEVLVLGLTYRANVRELAYSNAVPLIATLLERGATVTAYDPLLTSEEVEATGAGSWTWGSPSEARVIVTQTADPRWQQLDLAAFPRLELLYDGRNSLRGLRRPPGVAYGGVGLAIS